MGKPTVFCTVSLSEYIGQEKRTRRTEPSKYPEEKKSTEIAQVVASERAVAQTKYVAMHIWGCRTAIFELKKNWNILEKVIIEGDNPVQVRF